MDDFKNKRVTVMGLGARGGGIGTVQWLMSQGARVTVTDLQSEALLAPSIAKLENMKGMGSWVGVWGEHREKDFTEVDMVVQNPAVPRDAKYLQLARRAGVEIEMDSSLFLKNAPNRSRIIGVTGTKGKSTTTYVIGELMKLTGESVVVTGIEGTSPLGDFKDIDEETWVVFELSSWRLEALHRAKISPGVAVITSLLRDHLNTYDSFDDYIEAKRAILDYQKADDLALLNADDERVRKWEKAVKGNIIWYGLTTHAHLRPAVLKLISNLDEIPGEHTRRNLLPGIILAERALGSIKKIKEAVRRLKGLPHRLELVREIDGVQYINDSAATMPDATIAALKSFENSWLIHILGGNDKDLDFREWAGLEATMKVKSLIWLPGNVTDKMKKMLLSENEELAARFVDAPSMDEAVHLAGARAEAGDVVLLSPGATSFALFKDEFDRGDKFRAAVLSL